VQEVPQAEQVPVQNIESKPLVNVKGARVAKQQGNVPVYRMLRF